MMMVMVTAEDAVVEGQRLEFSVSLACGLLEMIILLLALGEITAKVGFFYFSKIMNKALIKWVADKISLIAACFFFLYERERERLTYISRRTPYTV